MLASEDRALLADITAWLIGPARLGLAPEKIVEGLVERLVAAGVPLLRVRLGQRVANPMIGAWGVLWNRGRAAEFYTVPRGMLATGAFYGSPFEEVIRTRRSFRRRLTDLVEGRDHETLFEQAAGGATDYLALPLEYGDGSIQGTAMTTDRPGGFTERDVELLHGLAPAVAAAFEPAAMRHSMASLLEVYLGTGPAGRVARGDFQRGQLTEHEAAVLVTDLRDFTGLSERLPPAGLLAHIGRYFEAVVTAVRAEGGDVLKFIGDGVLSVFPAEHRSRREACISAANAAAKAFADPAVAGLPFVAALHVGPVAYGNIGSLDRLDFTVVGPTVNYVSRLEGMAKLLGVRAVCSRDVARELPGEKVRDAGRHAFKGIAEAQPVFEMLVG